MTGENVKQYGRADAWALVSVVGKDIRTRWMSEH